MKFSIVTPTHNPQHLERLAQSLRAQTDQDFEWVIVPNGPLSTSDIPVFVETQRVVAPRQQSAVVGFLKRFACFAAKGEILVEVDHDDELAPTALAELRKAFEDGSDFVYSNYCNLTSEGTPYVIDKAFGYETRHCTIDGTNYLETVSFPPCPASLSRAFFIPYHLRAWRRDFYFQIGGHNESMEILEDQELLCRTYLHGTMKHVDMPLYIYHLHDQNTASGAMLEKSERLTWDLHDRFIYPLVERWCSLRSLRRIDLCGGHYPPDGYESVDLENADITTNLDEPWPFESNSVGVFRAHDAIEHLRDPIHTMKEAYRCLAPGGWFLIQVPSTDGRGAFQDPTHVSFWNSNSFFYYTRPEIARYIDTPVEFQEVRLKNFFPNDFFRQNNIPYVKADLRKFEEGTPGPFPFKHPTAPIISGFKA